MRARFVTKAFVALLACLAVGIIAAQEQKGGNAVAAKVKNPVATTPASIAAGEALYMRRCAACHGQDATGGPPKDVGDHEASNLVDDTWEHGATDGEIYYVIRNGVAPEFRMEAWDDRISETDTWNIVNFLRSIAQKK